MEQRVAILESQMATLMTKEVKVKKLASPAKVVKTAKTVKAMVLTGEEPTAADYRLDEVDASLCQARKLKTEDKRWSPAVYHESQCQGKTSDNGLCTGCASLLEKETEAGKFKRWNGRVGEDPLDHVHMLGTAWAEKCKWTNSTSATASPASQTATPSATASLATVTATATATATATVPKADKTAAKAAKEAEKTAKAAAKEAEKAAAKAAKEAEKAAAKAAKDAEKAKSKKDAPKKEKAPKVTVAVAAVDAPVSGEHDIMLIDGEMRAVKNGNVYEMDELTQEPGDFIGRLTGTKEAPSIDPDAEEEVESDTD
jgi:hypothetical protein